jgi:hypothetical protein
MISTKDIDAYTRCKDDKQRYTKIHTQNLHAHLKKRCPKLDFEQNWLKPFCSELTDRAELYLKELLKSSLKNLKNIADMLNIHYPGNTKIKIAENILLRLMYCNNHETIYGEDITAIDPKKLFKTRNGYCHHIDELLAYLISSGDGNSEPKDENNVEKLWFNEQQKQKFLEHPFHEPQELKRYHQMVRSKAQQQQRGMNLDFLKYIELIGKLGFVYLNDESTSWARQGFDASAKFLAGFTKIVEDAPPAIQEKIKNLRNFNDRTVVETLNDDECLHGIGANLIKIYFYHFEKYKKKFPKIQLLPLFVKHDKEYYAVTQFLGGKPLVEEIAKAQPGQRETLKLFGRDKETRKIIRMNDVNGKLTEAQINAMQELLSEFDLV